ncbi:protein kinase [Colletotrichum truncatum]|uniref:Protein kinase n=1 Tax=Colletotrichum truncatum TaxID=5467 RepID=A0ACC3YSN0_COLTU|nr:protein kinase [Colletotrichum truncatum]KAF6781237.1 protein kinase [Colletotrichum truncatum]
MEAVGLAVGIFGVVIAFKGAIETALILEDFFSDDQHESRHLALRYHIQKCRLKAWGDHWNAYDEQHCTLGTRTNDFHKAVQLILIEIKRLNGRAETVILKHDLDKEKSRLKRKFRWEIRAKAEFKDLVSSFQALVNDLESFTYPSNQLQLLTRSFLPEMLAEIRNIKMLESLAEHPPAGDRTLALSAKAKLLQDQLEPSRSTINTAIWLNRLNFDTDHNDNFGLIKETESKNRPVWIEWTILDQGPELQLYLARIEGLGRLLKQVSEPALRLPPFYGIYDDLDYELEHGHKRVGYVFGAPEPVSDYDGRIHTFKSDLVATPPITLRSMLMAEGADPPVLGDRFRLAFTLASAFSLFHAAGWLHKGLHSDSILFLQEEDRTISVTEPFITGFQYARQQNQASLSLGPLGNKKFVHYYHPDAARGFSKRLDLYSLGVVLCEIGRWAVIPSKISDARLRKLVTRENWRNYILGSRLKELGWRMGKQYQDAVRVLLECDLPDDKSKVGHALFAQEFQKKVLQPLSRCNA